MTVPTDRYLGLDLSPTARLRLAADLVESAPDLPAHERRDVLASAITLGEMALRDLETVARVMDHRDMAASAARLLDAMRDMRDMVKS